MLEANEAENIVVLPWAAQFLALPLAKESIYVSASPDQRCLMVT